MSNKYRVDTRGSCIMCLNLLDKGNNVPDAVYSLSKLSRYLEVDFVKIFELRSLSLAPDDMEMLVRLCNQCAFQHQQLSKVLSEWENIQNAVKMCVGAVNGILQRAENNEEKKMQYQRRLVSSDPWEMSQFKVTERFRRQLIDKCGTKVSEQLPFVRPKLAAQRVSSPGHNLMARSQVAGPGMFRKRKPVTNSSKSGLTLIPPGLMITPLGHGSSNAIVKKSLAGPACFKQSAGVISQKIRAEVIEIVDLEDEDEPDKKVEKSPESEIVASSVTGGKGSGAKEAEQSAESGLVIRSFSGANGIIITPGATKSTFFSDSDSASAATATMSSSSASTSAPASVAKKTTSSASTSVPAVITKKSSLIPSAPAAANQSKSIEPVSKKQAMLNETDLFLQSLLGIGTSTSQFPGLSSTRRNASRTNFISPLKKPSIKCIHCSARFRNVQALKMHVTTVHRIEMLLPYRNESVSLEVFKEITRTFFFSFKRSQEGDPLRPWHCKFCLQHYSQKQALESHLIKAHLDNLGNEIRQLQLTLPASGNDQRIPGTEQAAAAGPTQHFEVNGGILPAQAAQALHTHGMTVRQPLTPPPQLSPLHSLLRSPTRLMSPATAEAGIRLKCRFCGKICIGKSALKAHQYQFHFQQMQNKAPIPATEKYQCHYCPKYFRFPPNLRNHILTAHQARVFSKYFPPGTPDDMINLVVKDVLSEYRIVGNNRLGCNHCDISFGAGEISLLRSHYLLAHFDSIGKRLMDRISGVGYDNIKDPLEAITPNPAPQCSTSALYSNPEDNFARPPSPPPPPLILPDIKEEVVDNVVCILPD